MKGAVTGALHVLRGYLKLEASAAGTSAATLTMPLALV
jgi:hypothetical protein